MTTNDPSLRLRPLVSLLLFLSAYAPLMIIFVIMDFDLENPSWLPSSPKTSAILVLLAVGSSLITVWAVKDVGSGLAVSVTKAANKSGEMFGYTVPYVLSFMRIDLGDWRIFVSLMVFMSILYIMAYRTQTVFINPILAIAGYMLIDCTFKQEDKEIQAMVITKEPLRIGDSCRLERLAHYLYIAVQPEHQQPGEQHERR